MSIINATRLLESHEIAQQRPDHSIALASSPSRLLFYSPLCSTFRRFLICTGRHGLSRRFLPTFSRIVETTRRSPRRIALQTEPCGLLNAGYIFLEYNLNHVERSFYLQNIRLILDPSRLRIEQMKST